MIDKEQLLKQRLAEDQVDLPDGTVRIRSLTRLEALRLQASTPEDAEVLALSCGLVDPALTPAEARQALEAAGPLELEPVVKAIMELSGLGKGAQKSGRERPDDRGAGPA